MSQLYYYARRTLTSLLLVLLIATFLFFSFRFLPGDYATQLLQQGASAEQVEQVRESWGLNEPLYIQYFDWITNMLTGDAGTSRQFGQPVVDIVGTAIRNSMVLALPGVVAAFVIGSIYGALMGINPGSRFERYGIIPPNLVGTTPDFFIAIIFVFVFASTLDLFPAESMLSIEAQQSVSGWGIYLTGSFWLHYVLPFSTVLVKYAYYPAMVMRGSVVEVRNQEFADYQRLLGLSSWTRFKHMMKHASLPVITVFPSVSARAISGLVLIEIVFNWPGVGQLMFNSVIARDTPVIQFIFLLVAIWIVAGNYLVDILYTLIDPRITIEGE